MSTSLFLALWIAGATAQDAPRPEPTPPPSPPTEVATLTVPEFANTTCPIMGKPASASLFTDTAYGRIYVCCKPCIKKVQKEAEKSWKTAYPVVKPAGNALCPITGKAIDAAVPAVTVQGASIAVCCTTCPPKIAESTQIALAKANDAKLVDLANRGCPITGEETDPNTIAVIDGTIVRFANPKARSAAKADPKGTLEKARALREQERAGSLKLKPHPASEATDEDADDAKPKSESPTQEREDS